MPARSATATATTSVSRYSARRAWCKRDATAPAPCPAYTAGRVIDDGMHADWFDRIAPSYRSALDHFVGALPERNTVSPNLTEALKAQAIAEAAAISLRSGRMEPVVYPKD